MNPARTIIKFISEMDSEMLSEVLSNDITYQDANKEVIVDKLSDAFNKFRKENDSYLTPFAGVCNSKECTNAGCKGYSFVGNKSGATLDLIIEEKNGEVNDIYHCHGMVSNHQPGEYDKQINIYVSRDEKADFVPTAEYLFKGQLVDKAVEDIYSYGNICFSKSDVVYLVEKYKDLYKSTFDPFLGLTRFDRFENAFDALNDLYKFMGYEDKAARALTSYTSKDMNIESNLVNWLLQFEDFGLFIGSLIYYMDQSVLASNEYGAIIFNNRTGFKINRLEFDNEIRFCILFSDKYWDLIDKYKNQDKVDKIESDIENYFEPKKLKDYIDLSQFEIELPNE
jgi:hypothetical protein